MKEMHMYPYALIYVLTVCKRLWEQFRIRPPACSERHTVCMMKGLSDRQWRTSLIWYHGVSKFDRL